MQYNNLGGMFFALFACFSKKNRNTIA